MLLEDYTTHLERLFQQMQKGRVSSLARKLGKSEFSYYVVAILIGLFFFGQYVIIVFYSSWEVFNKAFQWPYILAMIDFISFCTSLFFVKKQKDTTLKILGLLYKGDLITDEYLKSTDERKEKQAATWSDIFIRPIEIMRKSFNKRFKQEKTFHSSTNSLYRHSICFDLFSCYYDPIVVGLGNILLLSV